MNTTEGTSLEGAPRAEDPTRLIGHVAAAADWVKFMATLGFVGAGLMALAGLVILGTGLPQAGAIGHFAGLLYLAIAGVYLIPLRPLYRSATAATRLKGTPNCEIATEALLHQSVFWRRLGILTIIGLGLSVLSVIIAAMVAIATH
jgi:hypothetical protein